MNKKLSTLFSNRIQSGFTLIELLVVLGILGILAAALLAAINPVEQLKKAQDTSLKNVASQYVSASVRYYSNHTALPWFAVASGGTACNGATTTLSAVALSSLTVCTTALISDGELKNSFLNSNNLSSVTITNPNPASGNASDVVACFQPQSSSQQLDPNTKYSSTGGAGTTCKSAGGTNNCYWCAQ
jgi:prepilin-type N-terminal cleavage/methylation domain-containing protein